MRAYPDLTGHCRHLPVQTSFLVIGLLVRHFVIVLSGIIGRVNIQIKLGLKLNILEDVVAWTFFPALALIQETQELELALIDSEFVPECESLRTGDSVDSGSTYVQVVHTGITSFPVSPPRSSLRYPDI
jgi:hypothetical protein